MNGNGADQVPIGQREIKPRDPNDPLATTTYKGQFYSREEANELIQREAHAKAVEYNRKSWEQSEAGRLCIAFYDAFRAYEKYLQEFPHAVFNHFGKRLDFKEHLAFEQSLKFMEQDRRERAEKDRRNLEKAQRAARCQHIHANGEQCGAPRVRGKKLCHMHDRMEQTKAERLDLGPMEDPDSIQMAIKKLQAAVIDQTLTDKQIAQLTNLLNIGAWNVIRTSGWNREMGK